MIDIRVDRCCMCPNTYEKKSNQICPGVAGSLHPKPTPCGFVLQFVDERGWKYKVMSGIGSDRFKARYQKPGANGWKGLAAVPWRETFDAAQRDLNVLADLKGWSVLQGGMANE